MPAKISLSLSFVFLAAVTVVGCAGAETPAEPDNEAAAIAHAEAAATSKAAPAAMTEIAAPESTRVHTAIAPEELSRLTSEAKAVASEPKGGATAENTIVSCPACRLFEPDLTVVEDDRPQTLCNAQYGCYPAFAKGFSVKNIGNWNAPTFHVAVLMGSDSYGFDVPGLNAGQAIYFQITRPSYLGPACGETAVVLVNPFNAVAELNYSNNAVNIAGLCLL
ncbi:MAG TPA: CARDB domain-containing protein [Polyangia bacterium]